MDNCYIHHGEEVQALVEDMNCKSNYISICSYWLVVVCKLIYLLLYSPDYDPIEQVFSSIKSYLYHHEDDLSVTAIVCACQSITPDKAEGYFLASGYIV